MARRPPCASIKPAWAILRAQTEKLLSGSLVATCTRGAYQASIVMNGLGSTQGDFDGKRFPVSHVERARASLVKAWGSRLFAGATFTLAGEPVPYAAIASLLDVPVSAPKPARAPRTRYEACPDCENSYPAGVSHPCRARTTAPALASAPMPARVAPGPMRAENVAPAPAQAAPVAPLAPHQVLPPERPGFSRAWRGDRWTYYPIRRAA